MLVQPLQVSVLQDPDKMLITHSTCKNKQRPHLPPVGTEGGTTTQTSLKS